MLFLYNHYDGNGEMHLCYRGTDVSICGCLATLEHRNRPTATSYTMCWICLELLIFLKRYYYAQASITL